MLIKMGERAADPVLLRRAADCHRAALDVAITQKSDGQKDHWNNLGSGLGALGELTRDPIPLAEAVSALQTALALEDQQADRLDRETTQNNLALAQRWLGDVTNDPALLIHARQGYVACEALDYRAEAPFGWAVLQWNIADLALVRHRLTPDSALLAEAHDHVAAARAFFVDGSEYQTKRCDELLAKIAEAAGPA